jgi:hypothetical protein
VKAWLFYHNDDGQRNNYWTNLVLFMGRYLVIPYKQTASAEINGIGT